MPTMADMELAWTNFDRPAKSFYHRRSGWDRQHPTEKPVKLLSYMINTYTKEGETVLDFTMGSGSTGIAAFNLKREFIGIEMDDKYFNMATKRIESHIILRG